MTKGQGEADSLVFVVDDDASMRQALTSLLQSVGLRVEVFGAVICRANPRAYGSHCGVDATRPIRPSCGWR